MWKEQKSFCATNNEPVPSAKAEDDKTARIRTTEPMMDWGEKGIV